MQKRTEDRIYECRQYLVKRYEKEGWTSEEIGREAGVSGRMIRYRLKRFGIEGRKERRLYMKDIHVRLPLTLYEKLKRKGNGRNISQIVRGLLWKYEKGALR